MCLHPIEFRDVGYRLKFKSYAQTMQKISPNVTARNFTFVIYIWPMLDSRSDDLVRNLVVTVTNRFHKMLMSQLSVNVVLHNLQPLLTLNEMTTAGSLVFLQRFDCYLIFGDEVQIRYPSTRHFWRPWRRV